ncbi:RND transporter [Marinobacterium nitratireducens]|uniref:RND transporter n=1 Tax=Marinobacterium nitratireducens TaxID=518897 RepID=A0A917ZCR8_9GAMM|nr:MMPL family transporter [Marinobacterium nitratireducens]GGO79297.1 RND transporter [Marinobacterium nitratireducens]
MIKSHQAVTFSRLENALFRLRAPILVLSLLATLFLAWRASFIEPDTRLERLIPGSHAFVENARDTLGEISAGGSTVVRVAVSRRAGSIYDYDYLLQLQKISDELSLLPGVDTGSLNSLWAPGMLWFAITPEGFESGPIISSDAFDGSPKSLEAIRNNVLRAELVGSYVSIDGHSSLIDFRVLPVNAATGQATDYNLLSHRIDDIRKRFENDDLQIQVIGDIKKVADLVDGFTQIALFFLVAFLITAALLYFYARCVRATLVPLLCSVVAVIWQLGALNLIGANLGVFSVLVPFLVFAIAVSHGVQMINSIAREAAAGASSLDAARISFHRLYRPGLLALISDGIGFAMLFVIDIGAIKDLAMVASIGVALVIFTNLILLPLLMSYIGVGPVGISRSLVKQQADNRLWDAVAHFAEPRPAKLVLAGALVLAAGGFYIGQDLRIGDLDRGAPELRADSRYNLDSNYITDHYSTSTDLMTVFARVPQGQCDTYKTIDIVDRLGWQLRNTPGVQSVDSAAETAKFSRYIGNEGNPKLHAIPRDERVLTRSIERVGGSSVTLDFVAESCRYQAIRLELADHRQETLQGVVAVVRDFALEHNDADIEIVLGSGNAAFEAATNEVIAKAQYETLAYIYAVVALMCLLMFRSLKAVACILLPLALTSVLCQALMTLLGIGVKVATLPVIALGVGIGVDYGIYIYEQLRIHLAEGQPLRLAYRKTLRSTGRAVSFTGVTLAVGVATWIISPIRFQADMGVLLIFMFLWNMVGALVLLPALVHLFRVGGSTREPSLEPVMPGPAVERILPKTQPGQSLNRCA